MALYKEKGVKVPRRAACMSTTNGYSGTSEPVSTHLVFTKCTTHNIIIPNGHHQENARLRGWIRFSRKLTMLMHVPVLDYRRAWRSLADDNVFTMASSTQQTT